jgi:hypothetical protein
MEDQQPGNKQTKGVSRIDAFDRVIGIFLFGFCQVKLGKLVRPEQN